MRVLGFFALGVLAVAALAPAAAAADGPTTTLSGKVTGIASGDRVVVWLHGAERTYRTRTDDDGRWAVRNVLPGTYLVRPDSRQYSFNPPTQVVKADPPAADPVLGVAAPARG